MRSVSVVGFLAILGIANSGGEPAIARSLPVAQDSAAVIAHARASADAFVALWRYYWEVSERYRHLRATPGSASVAWDPPAGVTAVTLSAADSLAVATEWASTLAGGARQITLVDSLRALLVECVPTNATALFDTAHVGGSTTLLSAAWAICPSWYVGGTSPPWDESTDLDAAIVPQLRAPIAAARAKLLDELEAAAKAFPGDGWVAGQRVRFALDQRDTTTAAAAAAACRAAEWWCMALSGYLLAVQNQTLRADLMFAETLKRMPESARCTWTDLSTLLNGEGMRTYGRITCAARDSINTRIWWLSDPLFLEPGNERRVEHYAREVLIALRSGTSMNERWDLGAKGGGGAVAEMLLRFGWPSASLWRGRAADEERYGSLGVVSRQPGDAADSLRAHGRFATAEYAAARYHTVPTWRAIDNPAKAQESDWELTADAHRALVSDGSAWWPREHYARESGPLVELFSQMGVFRRQDNALLAIGMDVSFEGMPDAAGDTLRGQLILSTGPDSMISGSAQVVVGFGNAISVPVPARPQLVSLELFGSRPAGLAARTRFGIEPAPPLSSMRPGEIAIAAPVLVRPPTADELPPVDPDAALARMRGSVIRDWTQVGFYWETYGINDGDTVDVAMRFEQRSWVLQTPLPGGRAAPAPSFDTVSFKWREPDAAHLVLTSAGPVPIQGRNVTLDLSRLQAGEYALVVSVQRPGGAPVTASRPFWVVPAQTKGELIASREISAAPLPLASMDEGRISVKDGTLRIDASGVAGLSGGAPGGAGGDVTVTLEYADSARTLVTLRGEIAVNGKTQEFGQVVSLAELRKITIEAPGGRGAPGRAGIPGRNGTNGPAGRNGCPATSGGDGRDGTNGGAGGSGGRGGRGGAITVMVPGNQRELLLLVSAASPAGGGGDGGRGGRGGRGGSGGRAGQSTCNDSSGGTSSGQNGATGQNGEGGGFGSNGSPGPAPILTTMP